MWLELSLRVHRREWPRVESALAQVGALSVTLLDAEDHAILEPAAGETPLWPELVINALFDGHVDRRGVQAVLQELVYTLDDTRFAFRDVADADWTRAWMDQYQPMRFGRRLWIYPSTVEPPPSGDTVVVRLDPGLAFGTGTHATTALCLEWLDGLDLRGKTIIDYGCGSGILAIAALKLGAARAIAIDNDPQALIATRDNAERNGIGAELEVYADHDAPHEAADVVVANILAQALIALAPRLSELTRGGGLIALSGVLVEQAQDVAQAYEPGCTDIAFAERDGWVRIDGRRRVS
jgi:ribosomal protein L11 methyltransferase